MISYLLIVDGLHACSVICISFTFSAVELSISLVLDGRSVLTAAENANKEETPINISIVELFHIEPWDAHLHHDVFLLAIGI